MRQRRKLQETMKTRRKRKRRQRDRERHPSRPPPSASESVSSAARCLEEGRGDTSSRVPVRIEILQAWKRSILGLSSD